MGQGQQTVEKGVHSCVDDAVGNGLRVADEEPEKLGDEYVHEYTGDFCRHHGGERSEKSTLFGPGYVSGSQILAYKGGQGHAHGGHGQEGEALNFGVGPLTAHGVGTEGIDVGLNDHIAQADHRVLYAGRQALLDDPPHHFLVPIELPEIQPQMFLRLPAHPDQAQNHAEPLGNDRGNGRTGNAPVEHGNEQQVQDHVGNGGDEEVV